jgi:two-component system sensor histidine kinase VicK
VNHLQKLASQVRIRLFALFALQTILVGGLWWLLSVHSPFADTVTAAILAIGALLLAWLGAALATQLSLEPTTALWQVIVHLLDGRRDVEPPKVDRLHVGRELVTSLSTQIYQLASSAKQLDIPTGDLQPDSILKHLPVPVIGLDKDGTVVVANETAAAYSERPLGELIGANFYSTFDLAFSGDQTLDVWLKDIGSRRANDSTSWDRVRFKTTEGTIRQFDLAAEYNKDNPNGADVILAMFDHSERYSQDDEGISFIALCVHELRTPLTLLRGYIEVFERELPSDLPPELNDYVRKMNAAARQLTAFVGNILNVARAESDQLVLSLQKNDWSEVLESAVINLKLLAEVRGITLECKVADDLPAVGVDRVSIYEVINNLVDNAIKYSEAGKKIVISSQLKDGMVETTVQDWGVGIDASTVPNLFTKFYRNFRNRTKIGGTGLGLYLCKAIVSAHGGNIWVQSKVGQGTTIGFTLMPYDKLASDLKNSDNKEIIRGAHGWIKNHSLYRR